MESYTDPGNRVAASEIHRRYSALKEILGGPRNVTLLDEGGVLQRFDRGALCYSRETGARLLRGRILRFWQRDGGRQKLGYPVTDQVTREVTDKSKEGGPGEVCFFQKGQAAWHKVDGLDDSLPPKEIIGANVRIKLIWPLTGGDLAKMIAAAELVFSTAGILVRNRGVEHLESHRYFRRFRRLLETGDCDPAGELTEAQRQLFAHRKGADAGDIVIYFVRLLDPDRQGCSRHPKGQPGSVVSATASRWTLAHEIGHVLGLVGHTEESSYLMRGGIHQEKLRPIPWLSDSDVTTLRRHARRLSAANSASS